jgi:HK97 family phage major capsid protein
MKAQINALRGKAAEALAAAREAAQKMAAGDTTARETFEKSKDAAAGYLKDIQSLEGLESAQAQLDALGEPSNPAQRQAKRRSGEGGADVNTMKLAHRRAVVDYVRFGADRALALLEEAGFDTDKAFNIVNGQFKLDPEETHALVGKDLELGGFLLPEDTRTELIRNLPGFSVIRGSATIKTTASRSVQWPTVNVGTDPYSSNLGAGNTNAANTNWKGEGAYGLDGAAPSQQSLPTFGNVRVPTHVWEPPAVVLGRDLLSDAAINLEAEIVSLFAEVKGMDEEWAFINGDGAGKPRGIMWNVGNTSAGGIPYVPGTHASSVKYAGIVNTFTAVPAQYRQRAKWLMNSNTFGQCLLLESTGGFPLFPANSLPGQLMGKDVLFSEFMPNVAGNAYPIIFGDFTYYYIVDQNEVRVQRLTERFAPNLGILVFARTGGQFVRTAPFRAMKIATS